MITSVIVLVIVLANFVFTSCVRNEQEEQICQPFLTSKETSPLLGHLIRNLTIDDDGEFACELVLQDETLPIQIRFTILEGLSWLAKRQIVQFGSVDRMGGIREKKLVRHLRVMAQIAKSAFSFSFEAGATSLDSYVGEPDKAVENLYESVYGKASTDASETVTKSKRFQAKREYARALAYNKRFNEAAKEYRDVLQMDPLDFAAGYALLDIALLKTSKKTEKLSLALERIEKVFAGIAPHATNSYNGFVPGPEWQPAVLSQLPSAKQFAALVAKREPVVMRFGKNLDTVLKWRTSQWSDDEYLMRKVKEFSDVQIECKYAGDTPANATQYGFSPDAFRKVVPFDRFVRGCYSTTPEDSMEPARALLYKDARAKLGHLVTYLNTQRVGAVEGLYQPPLHRLKDDIPQPAFLDKVNSSLTEINLWMGRASDGPTTSRLHSDATDNLYVVIKGSKTFRILAPSHALKVRTMSPTFAVNPNGLSYQYKPQLLHYMLATQERDLKKAGKSVNDGTLKLPKLLSTEMFPSGEFYDTTNYHFCRLNDPRSPESYGSSEAEQAALIEAFTSVELNEGDILYLPTGWFHEVSSAQGQHMAVNYWWRPPGWQGALEFEKEALKKLTSQLVDDEATLHSKNEAVGAGEEL